MGQIMRRHWMRPASRRKWRSPTATPVRVALLGENLVVFRDSKGRLGVLDEYCPHRRASLALRRATRNAGCAASITAGSSTSNGNVVEMASRAAPDGAFRRR